MFKDFEVQKMYWNISEVAELFQVNQSLIRFWEKEFDELKPKKSSTGNRLFSQKDIDVLKRIYALVKEEGMTLDGAKRKLKDPNHVLAIPPQLPLERLKILREKLLLLKEKL